MATLGTLPNYQICIFDLRFLVDSSLDSFRKKPLLCVTVNESPAQSIHFDPLDSRVFFTMDDSHGADLTSDILGDEEEFDVSYMTRGFHGLKMYRVDVSLKESEITPM